jgi:hypothetical protein
MRLRVKTAMPLKVDFSLFFSKCKMPAAPNKALDIVNYSTRCQIIGKMPPTAWSSLTQGPRECYIIFNLSKGACPFLWKKPRKNPAGKYFYI